MGGVMMLFKCHDSTFAPQKMLAEVNQTFASHLWQLYHLYMYTLILIHTNTLK